jgi:hypothetical protein
VGEEKKKKIGGSEICFWKIYFFGEINNLKMVIPK